MSRGTAKGVGETFTNKNGYTYEKTVERGWIPIHQIIAEGRLGRLLKSNERAYYIDADRANHNPDNIGVKIVYDKKSPQARLIALDADIQDLKDKLEDLLVQREALAAEVAAAKA